MHRHLLLGLITNVALLQVQGVQGVQVVQEVQDLRLAPFSHPLHPWHSWHPWHPWHPWHSFHPLHPRVAAAGSQQRLLFRARLAVVPIDVAQQSTVAGSGTVTATLIGSKLAVAGTFSNLKTPATLAKIHVGPKGIRGPAVFDLTVSKATSGTMEGTFELTPQQVEDLTKSRLYVQLHSEKAPEGNLWGWLLPQEGRK